MKELNFPAQSYILQDSKYTYTRKEDSIVGSLELLWTALHGAPLQLEKKDHRTNKRLKAKIRDITQFKDKDRDSRISLDGPQTLILEEDELELLKRLLESCKFTSTASDDLDTLWEIIDNAKDYKIPKLALADANPNTGKSD